MTALVLLLAAGLPAMPNPRLTPGATVPVTVAQVCRDGYARKARKVSGATKRRVYRLYGMHPHLPACCEVDHLISLELGGSNEIRNLWPEAWLPRPGAWEKDGLENHLHAEVCAGRMTLEEAQRQIRTDWYKAWLRMRRLP
jgi:hypothetical protein